MAGGNPIIARLLARLVSAVEKGVSPSYHARMLARVGVATGTSVAGMAASGFRGTVEGNRMQLELQMVSRELAGAFLPTIKAVTASLQVFRKWLERIGPQTQSLIMLGGLAAGGLGAVGLARFGLRGLAGGLGWGGAAAAGTMAAGATAGAASRGRFMPPLGTVGFGAAAFGVGHEVVGAGAAYGAARGAFSAIGPMGGTSMAAVRAGAIRGAARVAWPLALGATAYEASTGGYYSELRARGENMLTAGLGSISGGVMDFVSFGKFGEEFRKRMGSGRGPWSTREQLDNFVNGGGQDRNRVTLADAGFDAPGAAFERIANRLALVGANEESKDVADILTDIKNMIREALGLQKIPPPPPSPVV